MTYAVDWLPLETLTAPRITSALDAAISGWGDLWFRGRRLHLGRISTARRLDAFTGLDDGWSVRKTLIAVSRAKGANSRLAEWSLDRKIDELVSTVADRELLSRYEDRMMDDLVSRLFAALDLHEGSGRRPTGDAGGLLASVVDADGQSLLNLQFPIEALSALVKRGAPPRAKGPKLGSLVAAMSTTTVDLEASLGSVELSLQELRELAPGDVLVLDLGLEDSVRLTLAKTGALLARAKFTEADGRRALIVQD